MKKISGLFILMVALAAMVWVGFAQNADTAKDPVCGMSVAKATAKWTSDYKGTTYYFCGEGCKTEFAKNPDKYLAPGAETKPMDKMHGQGMMHGRMMQGQAAAVSADSAKDPVCGMTVKKADAKWTSDYKGTIYYFCSEGCKAEFAKNPDKYLASGAGLKVVEGMPLMMHGQMAAGAEKGCQGECPMMAKDVEKKIENIKDGVVITLTSKNPESVKKMQEHAAMMKSGQGSMMKAPSSDKTPLPGGPKAGCGKGCCEKK